MRKEILLSIIVFFFITYSIYCQDSIPKIDVTTELRNIKDKDHSEISADILFTWTTVNCKYVIIDGYSDSLYPPNGSITVPSSGNFIFIGVSDFGIVIERVSARHTYRKFTGVNGLIHEIKPNTNIEEYFRVSYKFDFITTKNREQIKSLIISFFQERNYTVTEANFLRDLNQEDICFFTNEYYPHNLLCDGKDCEKPVGQRRIERQIAFSIWLKKVSSIESSNLQYNVSIATNVMYNYRMDDDLWLPDTDGSQLGVPVCHEIKNIMIQYLR